MPIHKQLAKVWALHTRFPNRAILFPSQNDPPSADDRVFAVRRLPDGIAIFWAEHKRFRKIICSGMNDYRNRARLALFSKLPGGVPGSVQRLNRTIRRNLDLLCIGHDGGQQ